MAGENTWWHLPFSSRIWILFHQNNFPFLFRPSTENYYSGVRRKKHSILNKKITFYLWLKVTAGTIHQKLSMPLVYHGCPLSPSPFLPYPRLLTTPARTQPFTSIIRLSTGITQQPSYWVLTTYSLGRTLNKRREEGRNEKMIWVLNSKKKKHNYFEWKCQLFQLILILCA